MGNWERLVWNQRDVLLAGLGVTVEVCAIAFVVAVIGGLVLCLMRLYVAPLRPVAIVLIEFFRDTPIFVQLMWVAYVWPEIFGFPNDFLHRRMARARAAVERLSRRNISRRHRGHSAGPARGGLLGRHVAATDIRAASSCRKSLLASAPSIVNQFTVIVKSSTLISVITVPDLMSQSQKLVERLVRADRNSDRDRRDLHHVYFLHLAVRKADRGRVAATLRTCGVIVQ